MEVREEYVYIYNNRGENDALLMHFICDNEDGG